MYTSALEARSAALPLYTARRRMELGRVLANCMCSLRSPAPLARSAPERALEARQVPPGLWTEVLRSAAAVEAVYWNRLDSLLGVLQGAHVAPEEWACILSTAGAVEAVFADNLGRLVAALVAPPEHTVPSAWWPPLLRSKPVVLAVQQDTFEDLLCGLRVLPLPLWVDVLRCRATLQAVARSNFARVAQTLADAPPELWVDVLHSTGFTEAVAQDDPEQIAEALAGVSWSLWAPILDSSGACEAVVWRNLPEIISLLRKKGVSECFWCEVLQISTPELYTAVFYEELARQPLHGGVMRLNSKHDEGVFWNNEI